VNHGTHAIQSDGFGAGPADPRRLAFDGRGPRALPEPADVADGRRRGCGRRDRERTGRGRPPTDHRGRRLADGVLVEQSTDVELHDVRPTDSARDGLLVKNATEVHATGLRISVNAGAGTDVIDSERCSFELTSEFNDEDGIRPVDCADCSVGPPENRVGDNQGTGVVVGSTDCAITGLAIEESGDYGVRIDSSTGITLDGLTYADNASGDALTASGVVGPPPRPPGPGRGEPRGSRRPRTIATTLSRPGRSRPTHVRTGLIV
jgi:hypothetical protein